MVKRKLQRNRGIISQLKDIKMRVKTVHIEDYEKLNLGLYPNFSKTGSVKGMKDKFYGKDALLVKCGAYIYNVSSSPEIYNLHAY